jgi:high-affinity K+ transport system ATPase subunit B
MHIQPRYGATWSKVERHTLRKGDVVLVEAGDFIPADGEVIEGVASVDECAITGESAPVIRESGGDFSAVTGGTRVLSDWLMVRIAVNPGEAFLDRSLLELALENTNVKAQRLSFGPAQEAANAFRDSVEALARSAPANS